jgi:pimeloyl-ACP methyl ester carboxylesterase
LPDLLVQTRQVIAVEQQGHGPTADIDRPMPVQAMADDTRALLARLGIS